MRDYIPAGEIEKIVQEMEMKEHSEVIFTNGHIAKYAEELADRITKIRKNT